MHKVHICTQHLASFAILIRFLFCGGFKSISRRTVRRLIALHPKQNIESELKWKTCSGKMPSKCSCSTGKGLRSVSGNRCLDHLSATNWKVVLPRCVCCRIHCARSVGTIAIQLCLLRSCLSIIRNHFDDDRIIVYRFNKFIRIWPHLVIELQNRSWHHFWTRYAWL